MDWQVILSGVVIGIAVAAPIGPINLMAIRNTLAHGYAAGVFTGTGAVLGDGTYAVFAAFGITSVSQFILAFSNWIQAAGALVLIAAGINIIRAPVARPGDSGPPPARQHPLGQIGATYLLTITNPATLIAFVAIFGGVGNLVSRPGDYAGAATMVAAVMFGSFLWWVTVCWLTSLFREKVAAGALKYINWGSGAVIVAFGVAVMVRVYLEVSA